MGGYGEAAAIAIVVVAAAASAYAAYDAGEQQAASNRYNRQVALNEAENAKNAASLQAKQTRDEAEHLKSRQRAIIGASGFEEAGSPLLAMIDTAQQAEREAQFITYGGEVGATSQRARANLYGFQAKSASRAGTIGAGSTLLTAAAGAGSAYYGAAVAARVRSTPAASGGY